jgi:hypothetical protein
MVLWPLYYLQRLAVRKFDGVIQKVSVLDRFLPKVLKKMTQVRTRFVCLSLRLYLEAWN